MELTTPGLIFQTFPETLALVTLVISIVGSKLELKTILLIGLPHTIIVYLVRLLDLSFGVHTIILIIILAILLTIVLKIKFSWSLLVALFAMIILVVAETALLMLTFTVTGVEFEQITRDPILWILYGWPHIIFIFLLAFLINWWQRKRRTRSKMEKNNG